MGQIIIPVYSLIVGVIILVLPFMVSFIFLRKTLREKDKSVKLEDRVKILEAEVRELKDKFEDL